MYCLLVRFFRHVARYTSETHYCDNNDKKKNAGKNTIFFGFYVTPRMLYYCFVGFFFSVTPRANCYTHKGRSDKIQKKKYHEKPVITAIQINKVIVNKVSKPGGCSFPTFSPTVPGNCAHARTPAILTSTYVNYCYNIYNTL